MFHGVPLSDMARSPAAHARLSGNSSGNASQPYAGLGLYGGLVAERFLRGSDSLRSLACPTARMSSVYTFGEKIYCRRVARHEINSYSNESFLLRHQLGDVEQTSFTRSPLPREQPHNWSADQIHPGSQITDLSKSIISSRKQRRIPDRIGIIIWVAQFRDFHGPAPNDSTFKTSSPEVKWNQIADRLDLNGTRCKETQISMLHPSRGRTRS